MTIPDADAIFKEAPLTDEQAEVMLKRLSEHFKEPVKPIRHYCEAFSTWGRCIQERAESLRKELFPNLYDWDEERRDYTSEAKAQKAEYEASKDPHRVTNLCAGGKMPTNRDYLLQDLHEYESEASSVGHTLLQVHKSALLWRLLYAGQKLRTQKCPEHDGHWVGLERDDRYCQHGCGFTGWLPEPEDASPYEPGVFIWSTLVDGKLVRELRKDGLPYMLPTKNT